MWNDYAAALQDIFLPVFLAGLAIALALAVIARAIFQAPFAQSLALLTAFSLLGAIPGSIAGASRESIVGSLLTALLGLISALLAYLFGKDTYSGPRDVIPLVMTALLIGALSGLSIGGIYAKRWIVDERAYEKYKLDYQLYLEVEKQHRLYELKREYRDVAGSEAK